MPVRDDSVREQITQAGGTPLRVAIRPGTGTGPPLLLCNGIGMRLEAWRPFVDALDPAIEVICFDAPGVGGSQLPSLPYRFTTLALLLREMLHNLGYQQADVLGVSWGGGLAQQFALLNPRLCRRLILVATATGGWTMVPPNPLPPVKNLILRRWGDLWGGSAKTDPDGLTSALRKARISPLSIGFLYQNTALLGFTTLPLLPLIRQRTLVLTGDDDPIIPVANGRILAAGIPHATLHVYHGGHVELATRPSLLTPLITSFLAAPPHDARRAEQAQTGRHPQDQGPRQAADGTAQAAQATAGADALAEALQAARAAQQAAETAAGQAAAALRDAREQAAAAQATAREQAAPEGASALRADESLTGRDRERHIHSPRMFRSRSPSRSSARCLFRAYLVWPRAGVVPAEAIPELAEELRLTPGSTLLDLACGRGAYGLLIAQKAGTLLIGVDFSAQALTEAREQAARMGVSDANFHVGELTAAGLPDASVEAVLCTDAIQFPDEPGSAYDEIRRVLKPGGRVVLTCWEPLDRNDERLSVRIRRANLSAGLHQAGFTDVEVRDRPSWLAREHALWEETVTLAPGDDPALRSLHAEGVKSLQWTALLRRVLAVATNPQ